MWIEEHTNQESLSWSQLLDAMKRWVPRPRQWSGATGIILGNSIIDLALHDTYYIIAHFHFVLSLGAIISLLCSFSFNHDTIFISKNLLISPSSLLYIYHLFLISIGILLSFSPMHFLGFNLIPRRIPDYPDSFHSWNFLSSIGSGVTFLSFFILLSLMPDPLHEWQKMNRVTP